MQVTKAVITAAGRGVRQYPTFDTVHRAMLPVVDRDGLTKPVLQIIAEEAFDCGIDELGIVCAPGDEPRYRQQFAAHADHLQTCHPGVDWAEDQLQRLTNIANRTRFIVQETAEGYGHAVWRAKEFVGDSAFLLLLSDHLYISRTAARCARQVVDLATAEECAVSAVQATREHLIHQYGTVAGKRVHDRPEVWVVEEIIEKPTLTLAELRLQAPGLRTGQYLCFFGMHVLTPTVFAVLDRMIARDAREGGQFQLSPALNELARQEKYLALETRGSRHNLGVKFGLIETQIALAMSGVDRERMLSLILESMIRVEQA
ncbi:MAG: sugar phosphate nucleotidyltransferase [Planctomycetales bacterium]